MVNWPIRAVRAIRGSLCPSLGSRCLCGFSFHSVRKDLNHRDAEFAENRELTAREKQENSGTRKFEKERGRMRLVNHEAHEAGEKKDSRVLPTAFPASPTGLDEIRRQSPPEGRQDESPGQRPGNRSPKNHHALKGRKKTAPSINTTRRNRCIGRWWHSMDGSTTIACFSFAHSGRRHYF